MVHTHQHSCEEGMTMSLLLQEAEKIWHGPSDPQTVLKLFYSCTITAWWGNYLASDHKALQRVMCMAQYITGAEVPAIQDLYTRKALQIVKDSSQPSHRLFSLLPHDKEYQRTKPGTNRILNSFYPQAIRLLNS